MMRSSNSLQPIRIIVVGERNTGKSKLIMATERNTFSSHPPSVLPPTFLPSGFFYEPNPTIVIDTSSRIEDREDVIREIKKADSIVLTFGFDRLETLHSLSEYWLPMFRKFKVKVPIIVAGFKNDTSETTIQLLTDPITQNYPEIESLVEWSGTEIYQARKIIMYARNAVIYPMENVYDRRTNELKSSCLAALTRIFKICDKDNDGILSAFELKEFQMKCFNKPLGHLEDGIKLEGFIWLCTNYVLEERIQTLWIILRTFGYNNNLRLADMIPYSSLQNNADQSVELTIEAILFLKSSFQAVYNDGGEVSEPGDLDKFFYTAPDGSPFKEAPYTDAVIKTSDGGISIDSFLLLWTLMTLKDPAKALEYLMYIGYPHDINSGIFVTRRRHLDREERICRRNVVQCFVFGPKNAGKSALLNRVLGRSYDHDKDNESIEERYALTYLTAREIATTRRTLVMKEVHNEDDEFLVSNEAMGACDVAVFIYDSSDASSWNKCIDLLGKVAVTAKEVGFEFPCVMASSKTDLSASPISHEELVRVTEAKLGINKPIPICSKDGTGISTLCLEILTAARDPLSNLPVIDMQKDDWSWKPMALPIGAAALFGVIAACLHKSTNQS